MIQRIQSVYLIIVAGLMLAMLFLPLGYVVVDLNIQVFNVFGIFSMTEPKVQVTPWALYLLPICSAVLSLITIIFYKRRKLQVNMCYLIIFSLLLFYVFLFMYTYVPGERYATNIEFVVATAFPLVSIILEGLAIRGIKKDDKLVRSLDRIR